MIETLCGECTDGVTQDGKECSGCNGFGYYILLTVDEHQCLMEDLCSGFEEGDYDSEE